ncbi:MAG TPA: 3'-5' exonuclease [Ferrovibrio sp.]|jgi:DNA polymerase-3 subunit epsilon|uniref:3'-5' exonuclease n=1 Tax=Ferrovibrio sp. TaxID=1917215 RepID=UPI002B4B5005|nr:3'-5' exonuclease [Ferrovibrio sp.]HLT78444.1 3'-5' exonuclease [Ferrovibrio sp.]
MLVERAIPPLDAVAGATAIALDFETASGSPGSICAIGLAWIGEGRVLQTAHRLVRPHDMRFHPGFIAIHGIQPHDVEYEPEFPAVWDELLPHLEAVPLLLAHNAPFDIGVLRAALTHYGQPWPTLSFFCTVKLARAVWPDLENHRLSTVAQHIGFALRHHLADSDAAAAAHILLQAMAEAGLSDVDALLARHGIRPGRLAPGYHEACSTMADRAGQRRRNRLPAWLRN